MTLNKRQREYLGTIGLAADATDSQVQAFAATINAAQTAFFNRLADPPTGQQGGDGAGQGASPPDAAGGRLGAADAQGDSQRPRVAPRGDTRSNTPDLSSSPPSTPPAPPADAQAAVRAAMTAERQRIAHVQGVARSLGLGETWAQQQVDGGFSTDVVNAAAVHQAAANRPPVALAAAGAGGSVQVGVDRGGAAVAEAFVDAMALQIGGGPLLDRDGYTGRPIVGTTRQPHQWAGRFRGNSLMLASQFLQMCGRPIEGLSAPQIARAVFCEGQPRLPLLGLGGMVTSADFPFLLANAVGISLQQRYALYPVQWRLFAVDTPAGDFRTQTLVRHGELPILPEVKEAGEYTYVTFGEEREQWILGKRGHIVALSWEAVINDQLGAFGRILAMEGDAAARTDDTLAFAVLTGNPLMGDGVHLFDTATHANNVAVGSGAPPSMTTYTAMIRAMKTQAAPKRNAADANVYIVADPRVIICPVALEATVDILNLAERDPDIDVPMGLNRPNIYRSRFARASHPLLDAVATVGAFSWHACTDPAVNPAMIMGYLDGMAGPQLTQESGFDQDVRKYKVAHARAAKATDWRLWYRNVGY